MSRQDEPGPNDLQQIQAPAPAAAPVAPVNDPYSYRSYCSMYTGHYEHYCGSDNDALRLRAAPFCHDYSWACLGAARPPSVVEPIANAQAPPVGPSLSGAPTAESGLDGMDGSNPGALMTNPAGANGFPSSSSTNGGLSLGSSLNIGGKSASLGRLGSFTRPLAFLGDPSGNTPLGLSPIKGAPNLGEAPIGIGGGASAPYFKGIGGTFINPLSGVSSGAAVDAAGLPVSAMKGVSFGGMIPFGLSNMFG